MSYRKLFSYLIGFLSCLTASFSCLNPVTFVSPEPYEKFYILPRFAVIQKNAFPKRKVVIFIIPPNFLFVHFYR